MEAKATVLLADLCNDHEMKTTAAFNYHFHYHYHCHYHYYYYYYYYCYTATTPAATTTITTATTTTTTTTPAATITTTTTAATATATAANRQACMTLATAQSKGAASAVRAPHQERNEAVKEAMLLQRPRLPAEVWLPVHGVVTVIPSMTLGLGIQRVGSAPCLECHCHTGVIYTASSGALHSVSGRIQQFPSLKRPASSIIKDCGRYDNEHCATVHQRHASMTVSRKSPVRMCCARAFAPYHCEMVDRGRRWIIRTSSDSRRRTVADRVLSAWLVGLSARGRSERLAFSM